MVLVVVAAPRHPAPPGAPPLAPPLARLPSPEILSSREAAQARARAAGLALAAVLLLAAGLRLWGLTHDLPFSYFGDELHLLKMSAAMGTGDLNPHWFHKPAFLNYLMLLGFGLY